MLTEKLNDEILRAELRRDEGDKLKVYRCTEGKRTIGTGRNLDAVGIRPSETEKLGITLASVLKNGITQAQSTILLANDIAAAKADLDRKLPWWRKLDLVRQRVLINMCFNMGIGNSVNGLLSFKNTLRFIETGQWAAAAQGMRSSKWASQVGARAERLAVLMIKGVAK